MSKWREVRLGSFIELKRGYDLPLSKAEEGEFPVIASTGLRGTHSEYKALGPVITLGRSGSIGHVQLINENAWPLNTTLYVKDNKGNNIYFIYYFLKTIDFDRFNSGAGVPTLNRNHLNSLKIKIPDLETQEKIADILSTYDKLIENNNRRIKILEEIAEEIYKEWFVRMRFPGHKNTTFEKGIPKGWEVVKVRDLAKKIESGKRPKANYSEEHMVVSLGAADIKSLGEYEDSKEYLIPYSFFKEMRRGKVEDKDIAIYKDGAYTGKTTMFRDGFPYSNIAVNEHVFLVQCKDPKLQNYLLFTLKQKSYFDLIQALSMTSAQPGLNQNKLKNIKIQIPTNDLVEEFHILTESLLKQIFNLAKQNQNLKKQRDLLLPRLMNGTIQVK